MPPPEDTGRERSRGNPHDQGSSRYEIYRELMETRRELETQMRAMERDQNKKHDELSKKIDEVVAAQNARQAETKWVRHLAQVILTVFGTAVGGGVLYLLRLPGGPPGGGSP